MTDPKTYLASDSEQAFLWELNATREAIESMEARTTGRASRVLIDTRGKAAFLETFVEQLDAANDAVRIKPEFRSFAGQLICDAQAAYPMARVPIMGM